MEDPGTKGPVNSDGLETRAGTFSLTTLGGEIFNSIEQRNELRMIMESIIVIQAVHIQSLDQLNYVALCEQFEPVQVGEKIPAYVPMFNLDEHGVKISITWEKPSMYVNTEQQNKDAN